MDFFNKYKDLFEVPPGLSLPQSRLRIDNDLFVERVYQGTTQQEYSLSSKLKQLKRDYSAFENQMTELATIKKTPVRSLSRRGKESQQPKTPTVTIKNNENEHLPRVDLREEKQRVVRDAVKRQGWLQDERQDILKHSELDHIFNNKLNKIYELDDIKPSTLPPPQRSSEFDLQPRQGNFTIKQRSRKSTQNKSPQQERKLPLSIQNALTRREKAKSSLEFRRKKLQQLLRTLW